MAPVFQGATVSQSILTLVTVSIVVSTVCKPIFPPIFSFRASEVWVLSLTVQLLSMVSHCRWFSHCWFFVLIYQIDFGPKPVLTQLIHIQVIIRKKIKVNSLTQIFGGLLAYGISFAKTDFASWRIFFVVIGGLTMFVGLLVCFLLPDSPVKAKRFSDAEKVAALMRTKSNQRYPPPPPFPGVQTNASQRHAKRTPQEIPSLRNIQRHPRLARLPLHPPLLHPQRGHLKLLFHPPHYIRLHAAPIPHSSRSRWSYWRHLCSWHWLPL